MGVFIGLDVSLNKTAVCVVDRDGVVLWQGKVPSEPGPLVNHAAATLNCAPVAQTNPRAIAALSKTCHRARMAGSARVPLSLVSKPFVLFGLFQQPGFERGSCRVLGQGAEAARLPCVIFSKLAPWDHFLFEHHHQRFLSRPRNGPPVRSIREPPTLR